MINATAGAQTKVFGAGRQALANGKTKKTGTDHPKSVPFEYLYKFVQKKVKIWSFEDKISMHHAQEPNMTAKTYVPYLLKQSS